jgi:predicted RNA-binding protein with PIN domain
MFYIDGYNLLFKVQKNHNTLQEAREEVIKSLNKRLSKLKLEVCIIFDSLHQEGLGSHSSFEFLHVIFTAKNETADEWIYQAIKRAKMPQICTVVSSDKKLCENVKKLKAKVLNIDTFLIWLNKRQKIKEEETIKVTETKIFFKRSSKPSEGSVDYYLKIFEDRYQEMEKK